MKDIRIKSSKEYNAYIALNMDPLLFLLESHKIKKIFFITDENVLKLYEKVINMFKDKLICTWVIKPGEESKNIKTVIDIYGELLKCEADRKTAILTLGGGVVGDIGGFVASTFMRGMKLVHIPTSLMAQCDSSIGGKNGFNIEGVKNVVGTFYQPTFVFSNINFLKTLNETEFKSGMAEVIKYGMIYDNQLFKYIEENKNSIIKREPDRLMHIIHECIRIKGDIVKNDEYDTGYRNILNFGHTIGHGIESASHFDISHGEAVAVGMIIESYISEKLGYLDSASRERLYNLLDYFGLSQFPRGIKRKSVIEFIKNDKKKLENKMKLSLPTKIGSAIIASEITIEYINSAISDLI